MVRILAIESSCDETAAAVIADGREILSNVISSQIDIHTLYGGVVPEIASRKHMERIKRVVDRALADAGTELSDVDAIAVTSGPGLVGALLVGVSYAKGLAFAGRKPLIGVHHIEGHVCANFLNRPSLEPPFPCLIVSGGHTTLARVTGYGEYEVLGRSRDDAAGEAFDKVARALGLPYPGGPAIDKLSCEGNPEAIEFPHAKVDGSEYDFSFSGLKSAVLNHLNSCRMQGQEVATADVAASFQKAVIDVLLSHSMLALERSGDKRFALAGGVSANRHLRAAFEEACKERGVELICPEPVLCTDNAAMIGAAAYIEYQKGHFSDLDLNAYPALRLGERP
ncbi:MAG: tRNA (adenosine(37)-N6)-threonylcarbamoyltransferase complex transferase subunit TsaD [Lachnospiraceae bacterium]|nr:tRNA (adenosine(37)-N6)-threonylcarbamoyltransferase complex transferase subunit TsaD [Lachnospiraceae bacterium]